MLEYPGLGGGGATGCLAINDRVGRLSVSQANRGCSEQLVLLARSKIARFAEASLAGHCCCQVALPTDEELRWSHFQFLSCQEFLPTGKNVPPLCEQAVTVVSLLPS